MAQTQNHIHLQPSSEAPPGGWTTDDAPDNTYTVQAIHEMTMVRARAIDSLTGHRQIHRLVSASTPERVNDLTLRLRVTYAQYKTLKDDIGYECDFVPNYHENTGVSHAAQLAHVFLEAVKNPVHIDQYLDRWNVTVVLKDMDTGV